MRRLAEPLALKTLRAQVASQAVTVERFRREIQLARKVTHRNVCRTYDLGRHEMPDGDVVTFLTMELLRGISLGSLHARPRAADDRRGAAVRPADDRRAAGGAHRRRHPPRLQAGNLVLVPEAGRDPTIRSGW
jgi:serine/threonine-protein kinase